MVQEDGMFDKQFLGSKVGAAALVSIAAMVSFNIFALCYQLGHEAPPHVLAALHPVLLA
jgi:hypothetical protein